MNRTQRYSHRSILSPADRSHVLAAEFPRPRRSRRIRRHLRGYGAEVVWSLATLILIVWMLLIALTLWH